MRSLGTFATRVLALLPVGWASCAASTTQSPVTEPRTALSWKGDLRRGDNTEGCHGGGYCEAHEFTWPSDGRIRVEVTGAGPTYLDAARDAGPVECGRAYVDSASRLYCEQTVRAGQRYRFEVGNDGRDGTYELFASPEPSEHGVPPDEAARPRTPEETEPDDVVEAKVRAWSEGYQPVGEPRRGGLENLPTFEYRTKRGHCYLAIMVLEAGARPLDRHEWDVKVTVDTPERISSGGLSHLSERVLSFGGGGGDGYGDTFCARGRGAFRIKFRTHDSYEDISSLGTGPFRIQLYERVISEKEVRAEERDDDEGWCSSCMRRRLTCQQTGHTEGHATCAALFRACLRDGGMSAAKCKP